MRRELVVRTFNAGKSQQIFGEPIHPLCIFEDDLQELKRGDGVWMGVFDQRLNISLNRSERRAQFVADIGDKIATGTLCGFYARYIVKDGNGAASRQRRSVDLEDAPRSQRTRATVAHFAVFNCAVYARQQFRIAHGVNKRAAGAESPFRRCAA